MLPFWISIVLLSLVQGAVVAIPRSPGLGRLGRLRDRRWAAIPPLSVIAFVFAVRAAESAGAQGLSYLALVAVPLLAAIALGALVQDARPPRQARALLVLPLFGLAWADRGGLAGEGAAVVLTALSCIALGTLLAALTPARWLAAGIVTMAMADTALVVSDLLQRPNSALNAAHPAAGLPRLQSAVFGSAVMGYGDLFIAGALGGLLALSAPRPLQLRGALLTGLFALAFDLLFLLVHELPATVPVASALIVLILRGRLRHARPRPAPPAAALPARPAPAARTPAAR